MKAGKIKTYIIMIKSILLFTKYCAIAIFISFAKDKNKIRTKMDRHLKIWAEKIMSYPKAKITVTNPEKIKYKKNKPYILMSNHASLYDIPIIYLTAPGTIRMIAKKELFKIPLFGTAMKRNEVISIDRSNRESAIKSLEIAKQRMKDGIVLWMAPEGTRARDGKLLEFKKGVFMLALETGATIYPIGIKGAYDILPAKTFDFSLNQNVTVTIGDPIDASKYTMDNRDDLIKFTRESIISLIE